MFLDQLGELAGGFGDFEFGQVGDFGQILGAGRSEIGFGRVGADRERRLGGAGMLPLPEAGFGGVIQLQDFARIGADRMRFHGFAGRGDQAVARAPAGDEFGDGDLAVRQFDRRTTLGAEPVADDLMDQRQKDRRDRQRAPAAVGGDHAEKHPAAADIPGQQEGMVVTGEQQHGGLGRQCGEPEMAADPQHGGAAHTLGEAGNQRIGNRRAQSLRTIVVWPRGDLGRHRRQQIGQAGVGFLVGFVAGENRQDAAATDELAQALYRAWSQRQGIGEKDGFVGRQVESGQRRRFDLGDVGAAPGRIERQSEKEGRVGWTDAQHRQPFPHRHQQRQSVIGGQGVGRHAQPEQGIAGRLRRQGKADRAGAGGDGAGDWGGTAYLQRQRGLAARAGMAGPDGQDRRLARQRPRRFQCRLGNPGIGGLAAGQQDEAGNPGIALGLAGCLESMPGKRLAIGEDVDLAFPRFRIMQDGGRHCRGLVEPRAFVSPGLGLDGRDHRIAVGGRFFKERPGRIAGQDDANAVAFIQRLDLGDRRFLDPLPGLGAAVIGAHAERDIEDDGDIAAGPAQPVAAMRTAQHRHGEGKDQRGDQRRPQQPQQQMLDLDPPRRPLLRHPQEPQCRKWHHLALPLLQQMQHQRQGDRQAGPEEHRLEEGEVHG